MATLTPFRDFTALRDAMDRMFDETFSSLASWTPWTSDGTGMRYLPLDVYETGDEVIVRAVIPGVDPQDIEVQFQHGVLTLRAKTEAQEKTDGWRWHIREIPVAGEAIRQVTLPQGVDPDKATTAYEHGVLTLRLPKVEEAKPKRIPIQPMARLGAGTAKAA